MSMDADRFDTSSRGLYFASSDGGIEHSITQADFDCSLVYNLLFEPAGLVLSDISFFNCTFLINHVESVGRSLFESALSRGLVVPAFRTAEISSFREALQEFATESVLGIEPSQYRTSPGELAKRLDAVYLRSQDPKRIVWPDNMGGSFAQLVSVILQQPDFPTEDEHIARLWRDSQSWRVRCLSRAEQLTARKGGMGIRRAEIWNAAGQLLGVLDQDGEFDKPRDLVAGIPDGSGIQGQVKQFVNVVNICYQRNQALRFGVMHNIPPCLSRDSEAAIPGLALFKSLPITNSFEMEVMLPAFSALLRADTGQLIAVRDSDPGAGYFERRQAWAGKPSSDNADELRKAIRRYAVELLDKARGPQKRTILGFASQRGRKLIDSTVGIAIALGMKHSGIPTDFSLISGMASALTSDTIVSTLQVLGDGPYVPKERHTVIVESAPELNLPA